MTEIYVVFCNDSPERAFKKKKEAEEFVEEKMANTENSFEYWHVRDVPFGPAR